MAEHNKAKAAKKTRRMRITIAYQVEYDAPEDMYEDAAPDKMADADEAAATSSPFVALQGLVKLPGGRFKVKVVPVITKAEQAGLEIKE